MRRFDAAPEIVADEIYLSMQVSLGAFYQAVKVETPVNLGALRGSITMEIAGSGVSLTGQVATPLIYGWPVERGRRPGRMPPIADIMFWVYRKGIKFMRMTKKGPVPLSLRQTAYVIARRIGEHGTKGAAMFHKGFLAASDKVEQYWRGLPARVAKRI